MKTLGIIPWFLGFTHVTFMPLLCQLKGLSTIMSVLKCSVIFFRSFFFENPCGSIYYGNPKSDSSGTLLVNKITL